MEQQYTISGLQQLILDQAHQQISSEQELGKYYRDFRLLSHNLIKMCRISWQKQVCPFLAGLQPSLVSRINFQLKAKLLDHFPLDPYKIENIYDATLYTLRSQPSASSVPPSRNNVSLLTQPSKTSPSLKILPNTAQSFSLAQEHSQAVPHSTATTVQVHAEKQHVLFIPTSRDILLP